MELDYISDVGISLGTNEVREVSLLAKYTNFIDIFSKEGASELPKANL